MFALHPQHPGDLMVDAGGGQVGERGLHAIDEGPVDRAGGRIPLGGVRQSGPAHGMLDEVDALVRQGVGHRAAEGQLRPERGAGIRPEAGPQ